jgi:hypothetical protein
MFGNEAFFFALVEGDQFGAVDGAHVTSVFKLIRRRVGQTTSNFWRPSGYKGVYSSSLISL